MSDSPPTAASRGSLLIIFLTVFIDLLGFGMVLPLLPLYADQFTEGGDVYSAGLQLGLLMASFSIMQFICAPLWGRLSDSIGRRPVLIIGLAGSVVFYSLFAFATIKQSLLWLFVSRIGAGVAGATIPTAQAYIADCTTAERRSRGMALIGMAFGLGFTFGPLLGMLAVPTEGSAPGPGPGYAAAGLSAAALLLAIFRLPESLRPGDSEPAERGFHFRSLSAALTTPSIGLILLALLVCVFSFANFETTLSLLIKGDGRIVDSPFKMSFRDVCLTYAFIGFTLALVQGGLVRRVAGRVSEASLASFGALLEIGGFVLMIRAISSGSTSLLYLTLAIVVTGFAFMQPSLNGLLSRRSDPAKQGQIMGVGQSVSAMARILGSGLGIPMLEANIRLPYYLAAGLMALGLLLVQLAGARGSDWTAKKGK